MAKRTSDALKIIDRMIGEDVELRAMIDEELLNAEVSQLVYDARTAAELSQQELADLVETSRTTISRLEDADYDGHSLTMLRRIAVALNMRLELRFVHPDEQEAA